MRNRNSLIQQIQRQRNVNFANRQRPTAAPVRLATQRKKAILGMYAHAIKELKVVYRLLVTAQYGIESEMGIGTQNTAAMGQRQIDNKLAYFPYADDAITLSEMVRLSYDAQATQEQVRQALFVSSNRIRVLVSRIDTAKQNIGINVNSFKEELERRFQSVGSNYNLD
jgi:hypothetical protein